MKDHEMDESIRELARRLYNPPPDVPRDEMWEHIRAARLAGAAAPQPASPLSSAGADESTAPGADAAGVIALASRRRGAGWWAVRVLPLAALLVLSFGLGRLSWFYQSATRPVASRPSAPSAPATPDLPRAEVRPGPAASAPLAAGTGQPPVAGAGPVLASPRVLAARAAGRSTPTNGARTALYRLAAQQTLGQAEMLLTSFRAEVRAGGAIDPQVTTWAGDVLSSTRLLLDSPAARDARLRGLLEDLELVLAQIVQLGTVPPDSGATDLIDRALQQRDLMLRLRSAVPVGASVGA